MRGAPQVGFSAVIRKISSRTSLDSFFLPTCFLAFEIKLQYSRKPARCQPTTVLGLTSPRDCFQAPQRRQVNTQKILSTAPIRGLGCLRFSTASCCRRARFSRSRLRCDCKQRVNRPNHNPTWRNIRTVIADTAAEECVQAVDFRAGQNFGDAQVWLFELDPKYRSDRCRHNVPRIKNEDRG